VAAYLEQVSGRYCLLDSSRASLLVSPNEAEFKAATVREEKVLPLTWQDLFAALKVGAKVQIFVPEHFGVTGLILDFKGLHEFASGAIAEGGVCFPCRK